jgi:hypothetical protein
MDAVRAYIEALAATADVVAYVGDGTHQGSLTMSLNQPRIPHLLR